MDEERKEGLEIKGMKALQLTSPVPEVNVSKLSLNRMIPEYRIFDASGPPARIEITNKGINRQIIKMNKCRERIETRAVGRMHSTSAFGTSPKRAMRTARRSTSLREVDSREKKGEEEGEVEDEGGEDRRVVEGEASLPLGINFDVEGGGEAKENTDDDEETPPLSISAFDAAAVVETGVGDSGYVYLKPRMLAPGLPSVRSGMPSPSTSMSTATVGKKRLLSTAWSLRRGLTEVGGSRVATNTRWNIGSCKDGKKKINSKIINKRERER